MYAKCILGEIEYCIILIDLIECAYKSLLF